MRNEPSRGEGELKEFGKVLLRGQGGGPISAVTSGYRSFFGFAKSNTSALMTLVRGLFRGHEADPLPDDAPEDARERFLYASRLYGRDETYIRKVQDNKYRLFSLFFAACISMVGIDIATWYSYITSPIFVLAHIAPIFPLGANAIACAFHNWQLRNRRLDSFREFCRHPKEWWPEASSDSSRNGTGRSVAAIVILASCGLSGLIVGTAPGAMAQASLGTMGSASSVASNPAAIFAALPSTDLWGSLLGVVFPGIGPISGLATPLNNAIANAFGTLIACLMALGAAIISYDTLTSTVDVAHDGSLLNRKWHTIWSPVRVAYGMASLAPVVNGYCLLQIAVIWGAVVSGNIGNAMWSAFVDNIGSGTLSQPMVPQTINTVSNIMGEEVCFAFIFQDWQNKMNANPGANLPQPQRDATHQVVQPQGPQVPGFFSVPNPFSPMPATSNMQTIQWKYGPCGTVSGQWETLGSGGLATFSNAQITAIDTLRQQLQPIAQQLVQAFMPGPNSGANTAAAWQQFVVAQEAYNQTLNAAAQAYVDTSSTNTGMRGAGMNSIPAFQQTMTSEGWAFAGAAYMTVARINAKEIAAMQMTPSINSGMDSTELASLMIDGGNEVMRLYRDWLKTNLVSPDNGLSQVASSAAIQAMRAGDMHQNSSDFYQMLQYFFSSDSMFQQFMMNIVSLQPGQMDGLQQMVNLGDYIVGISEGILALYIGTNVVANDITSPVKSLKGLFSAGSGGGTPLSFGTLFFGLLATSIFGAGVYDSLILPMLPFTHFLFATMGILVTVIEGVIAAPLWALMHVRMAGEEFIQGEQRAGYQLFFNLLFRIPLTLLGLFFSILVFNAMIWLMAETIFPAMAAATAESLFGAVSMVVMIVFITIINYQVASRSFLLINQIPDRVTRWFGASDHVDESSHVSTIIGSVTGGACQAIEAGGGAYKGAFMGGSGVRGEKGADNKEASQGATVNREAGIKSVDGDTPKNPNEPEQPRLVS
jgi:conjugal transfer/type IV secretion protein DotA/TraY